MRLGHRKGKFSTKYSSFLDLVRLKMSVNDVMDVGADFICFFNKNSMLFCKYNINNMEKDLPEGYNLLLNINPMVPGDRPLLDIGCNFNFWKVLSFITKEVKLSIKL